jgi:hypothetical protein
MQFKASTVAQATGGRWHGIYAVTEGADISNTANPSFTVVGETLAVARKSERSYHADF